MTLRAAPLTILHAAQALPLTCTRAGTCCHGKQVWITPWELARLAGAMGMDRREVVGRHTVDGGIRLRFSGDDHWRGQRACDWYDAQRRGCRAYAARPLACRLYPLGVRRVGDAVEYVHEGAALPCLDACPEVTALPQVSVGDYLAQQGVAEGLAAQEATLGLVAELGGAAFAVAVDSGLLWRDAPGVLRAWEGTIDEAPQRRARALGEWLWPLLVPDVDDPDPRGFADHHQRLLSAALTRAFAALRDPAALIAASATCLRLAAHLAQSAAGDAPALLRLWTGRLRQEAGRG